NRKAHQHGNHKSEETIGKTSDPRRFELIHVQFQSRNKHNVDYPDGRKELDGSTFFEITQHIRANDNTRNNKHNNARDFYTSKKYRGNEDNQQNKRRYRYGIGERKLKLVA